MEERERTTGRMILVENLSSVRCGKEKAMMENEKKREERKRTSEICISVFARKKRKEREKELKHTRKRGKKRKEDEKREVKPTNV